MRGRLQTIKERAQVNIAWLMPRWLVYWCAIRLVSYASQDRYSSDVVTELGAMEALRRWKGDE